MSDLRYPSWQEPVRLALVEFYAEGREEKISAALQAIAARRAQLNGDVDHGDERLAMEDAINILKSVRRNGT
jgi:hypothetical protein